VQGDCLEAMAAMPDGSVDAVVTDAPYGLSFMGKAWDKGVPGVEVWAQALRVLKPGGHLLAFAGTRTQHRMAGAIEDAGFEIRDMIAWVYGSGFPKSLNVGKAIDAAAGAEREVVGTKLGLAGYSLTDGKGGLYGGGFGANGTGEGECQITAPATPEAVQWDGWGTALKPALEPLTLARKPLDGTVAANVLKHGVGGINVAGCRVETKKRNAGYRKPGSKVNGVSVFGNTKHVNIDETLGRFPANLIHDGSEEVVACFPETITGKKGARPEKGIWGTGADTSYHNVEKGGSAARFFYCAKASKEDREDGLRAFPVKRGACVTFDPMYQDGPGEFMCPMRRNIHPTVKPTDLMRYLCRLITPPGGIVLDPFMGSGSTGRGAALEGFRFIGCELETEYFEIAVARIAKAVATPVQQDMLGGA
jgi:DNA modification methylase